MIVPKNCLEAKERELLMHTFYLPTKCAKRVEFRVKAEMRWLKMKVKSGGQCPRQRKQFGGCGMQKKRNKKLAKVHPKTLKTREGPWLCN